MIYGTRKYLQVHIKNVLTLTTTLLGTDTEENQ